MKAKVETAIPAVIKTPRKPRLTTEEKLMANTNASLVDEFVVLHNMLAPQLDHYEKLKKKIVALANSDKTGDPITLVGINHYVDFSAPTMNRECRVSPAEFVEMTGLWDALSVSVTKAKEYLSEAEMDNIFMLKQGSRRFKRVR